MELKMNDYQLPGKISFNFEELKAELAAKVSMYETLVYGEDEVKTAKADRANLNKLKKALNDERIRQEKEYMKPFNEFKAQINEIIRIIDKPIGLIDCQIRDYEEQKKQEKITAIERYFEENCKLDWLKFNQIFDPRWANASVSLKSVCEAINTTIEQIEKDLSSLSNLPEFAFEAIEAYKSTLDMNKAISEGMRLSEIQKRKAEAERLRAEQEAEQERLKAEAQLQECYGKFADTEKCFENVGCEHWETCKAESEEPREWVGFKAYLTVEDANLLNRIFATRGIPYEQIKI